MDEKLKRLEALKELLAEDQEIEKKIVPEDKEDDEDDEAEDEEDDKEDDEAEDKKDEGYAEHLAAMFSSSDLSEETQDKIKVLFEAAVGFEVEKQVTAAKAKIDEDFKAAVDEKSAELKREADAYLSFVVEEWSEKNTQALASQIKLDIFESFVGGLRNLFIEHNINIPDEQVQMAEELIEKVASLEEDIKTLSTKNVELVKESEEKSKELTFKELTEDMTALDVEKLKALVEAKQFDSLEDYKQGVALIKESYFKTEEKNEEETEIVPTDEKKTDATVNLYAEALSRQSRKK